MESGGFCECDLDGEVDDGVFFIAFRGAYEDSLCSTSVECDFLSVAANESKTAKLLCGFCAPFDVARAQRS